MLRGRWDMRDRSVRLRCTNRHELVEGPNAVLQFEEHACEGAVTHGLQWMRCFV